MKKYARILGYLKLHRSKIALYILFVLLSVLASIISIGMLMPFLQLIFKVDTGVAVTQNKNEAVKLVQDFLSDMITTNGPVAALGYICLIIIGSIFLKNLFLYLSYYVLAPMRNDIMNRFRRGLYDKILQLPIGYFTEKRKGDLMSRMTNDVNELEGSVLGTLEGYIKEPITILAVLGALVYLSPQLSLFIFIFLPLTGFIIGRVSRSLKRQSNIAAIKLGEALSVLDETLGGLRIIKAFNAEKLLRNRFFGINDDLFRVRNKMNYRRDLASPMSEFLGVLVLCGILYFGGRLVLGNGIGLSGDAFIAYIGLFSQIINPAKALSSAFYNMQKGSAAMDRIEEVLKAPIAVVDKPDGKILEQFSDSIEFRNVSFFYEDAEILSDINLTIKKGTTVALVGSSGAGKSTLADLVPRFHDVAGGTLLIDGVDIREYSIHSLRNQISIVTQEPILFNDTISSNIALGKQEAGQADIESAARVANAHEFILKKEEGYATNIGDRGSKLSGGERQRLTIARAVLKNPPILILDEATSSLDTESERLVQDAIYKMMENRTSIVIAHRLSTIRHADEIVVLQKGRIVERGTHDGLMEQNGFYRKLVDMQEVK